MRYPTVNVRVHPDFARYLQERAETESQALGRRVTLVEVSAALALTLMGETPSTQEHTS
jgi:hypothetical protein